VILVFGGNGQLGRELARAAESRMIALQALSRTDADIADRVIIAAALQHWNPTLVVNAAAYTKVDRAEKDIENARLSNEIGPAVLAEGCAAAGVPLVHVSTDYVFDGSKQGAYLEADPACPINVYGRTKVAGEDAVRHALARHIILRTAWVYSEYGSNFLKTILRLAATRDELRIVADQYGSPTSAREIADAVLRIAPRLLRDGDVSGTYHFTSNGVTTWHGFAQLIVTTQAPLTGHHPQVTPIQTAEYPTPAKRPTNSHLDCSLFAQTFGFLGRHWAEEVEATTRAILASPQWMTQVA
jgi:dTDP-4-dehydrorhamnose reductase